MYYYYTYTPPYFLFIAGLLSGVLSGFAFNESLKQLVKDWTQNRSSRTLANMRGARLFIPFLGIAGGICLFLTSGLEIFGFPPPFTFIVAFPLTVITCGLIWRQLGQILMQLEKGGSKALDLDSFWG